ncbi:hypothetical protein RF11_16344 [Thelohanellus kitauei]|uniref:Reverse transcriptase RNase H-like domain-containing protein n=1 Tax=Thelohanellus kitauei TaxID=669202 RepID=A0A0C2J394_THEKT|nr:hypothetical protein RF11_16344 [Thelohanellus kitauei]
MDQRCIRAVETLKKMISEATLLTIVYLDIPIIFTVHIHRFPDCSEAPKAHASKTLSAQKRLALSFEIKMFNQYLYGRKFELIPDNQCLVSLFNPLKKILCHSNRKNSEMGDDSRGL